MLKTSLDVASPIQTQRTTQQPHHRHGTSSSSLTDRSSEPTRPYSRATLCARLQPTHALSLLQHTQTPSQFGTTLAVLLRHRFSDTAVTATTPATIWHATARTANQRTQTQPRPNPLQNTIVTSGRPDLPAPPCHLSIDPIRLPDTRTCSGSNQQAHSLVFPCPSSSNPYSDTSHDSIPAPPSEDCNYLPQNTTPSSPSSSTYTIASTTVSTTSSRDGALSVNDDEDEYLDLIDIVHSGSRLTFSLGSISTTFTVDCVLSRSNQKLIMAGQLNICPDTRIVAKLRCVHTIEQHQQAVEHHSHECHSLQCLSYSPQFPNLLAAGSLGTFPVLMMTYFPLPWKMYLDLSRSAAHIQGVVKQGLREAVVTVNRMGMTHPDLKAENVL
ncbi:hypothetical protein K440DRAFT_642766 [Wilcoxina mikolae CBS 423.85]|nr:hypothetical protein K440DRAFT_642766 [Wilcoxina mikolae CBS 423.85]